MSIIRHRKPAAPSSPARRRLRIALLAATGLSAFVAATGTAQASHYHGVAIEVNGTYTLANRAHENRFEDSFTIHEEGTVFAASLHNQATARSVNCSAHDLCRSVSLSFQIVTMAGTNIHLNAVNRSNAANVHCPGCETLAGAYQFIVSTPRPFTLSPDTRTALDLIEDKLDALNDPTESITDVKNTVDDLATEVIDILKEAAAAAPKGPRVDALAQMEPQITVHGMFHS
jgi:hypothetical protein